MPHFASVVLCILDGWGLRANAHGNAVALANTPTFDRMMRNYPCETLITYGDDVGLPSGQMGNSEVGHTNIGAGRIVETGLRRINRNIQQGNLANLDGIKEFINQLKISGGNAHLCGILSDGGVHGHIDHMIATANIIHAAKLKVYLHLFTDGRDVAPKSAKRYLNYLHSRIVKDIVIATLSGRYYALDRDNRWQRIALAYRAIMQARGESAMDALAAIQAAYDADISDEFIHPTVVGNYSGICDGDGILFLNFRTDRARQILSALGDPNFTVHFGHFDGIFDLHPRAKLAILTGFAQYSIEHDKYMRSIFAHQSLKNTLGEWVSIKRKKQFRIAETEKYPHVTFFFNGGTEVAFAGESRYLAPSPKVASYDLCPEMAAAEVTEKLLEAIHCGVYDLIVVNYANPDMVGHTGNLSAAINACEVVDSALKQVILAVEAQNSAMIVCADHGNCEIMIDSINGGIHTAHTTNPVPIALIGAEANIGLRSGGYLADIAPTILHLMHLECPPEMSGKSLII